MAKSIRQTKDDLLIEEMELLDEDFEYALLESNNLVFPITETSRKLTQFQRKLQRITRNKRIHDLALEGGTIRSISLNMTADGWHGVSRSNVSKVLVKALEISQRDVDMSIERRRQLELDKIDNAELMHLGPFLAEKDPDAAEKRSRIVERLWRHRAALLNLGGNKVKIEVPTDNASGVEVKTEIRVILPVALTTEEDEERNGQTAQDDI